MGRDDKLPLLARDLHQVKCKLNRQTDRQWVILNVGTSAQLSYTVPVTSVYAGTYEQKTNQEQTLQKTKDRQIDRQTDIIIITYSQSVGWVWSDLEDTVSLWCSRPSAVQCNIRHSGADSDGLVSYPSPQISSHNTHTSLTFEAAVAAASDNWKWIMHWLKC